MTGPKPLNVCSWCGHPVHRAGCPRKITAATAPSGGKTTPTEERPCPCAWRHAVL